MRMPLSIKITNTKNKKEEEILDENEVKELPRIERKRDRQIIFLSLSLQNIHINIAIITGNKNPIVVPIPEGI